MKNVKKRTLLLTLFLLCIALWGCGKNESTQEETIVEAEEQNTVEQSENIIEFSDSYIQEEQNDIVDIEEEEVDIEPEVIWKPNDIGITKKSYLAVNNGNNVWCEYIYEDGKLKKYIEYDVERRIRLIEEYDNNGNVDRIFEHAQNGAIKFNGNKIKYEYDEHGKVINANINGNILKYEYDEQEKCIAKQKYFSEDDVKENRIWVSYIYKYYPSGIINKILQEDNVGNSIIIKYLYYPNVTYIKEERKAFDSISIYDITNRLIAGGEFKDGVLVRGEECVFDEKGNIVKILYKSDYNELIETQYEYVYDESGRIIEKISYYKDIKRDFFEYDSEGKIIRIFSTGNEEDYIVTEYIYEYDDEGRIVKVVDNTFKESGITMKYIYKYDEYGNRVYEGTTRLINAGDRIIEQSYSSKYNYDSEGKIVSASDDRNQSGEEIFFELPALEDETE